MKIAFKNSFLKSIQKLKDEILKQSLLTVITHTEQVNSISEINNIKKLKGYSVYYRIRVGDYRIGLKWEEAEQTLYFVTFDHRKNIYKKFP